VISRSARVSAERPFYDLYAAAYDALITGPVEPWVQAVDEHLVGAGREHAAILDAGCGTGRHARGLIDRGHRVTLMDASERLLAVARGRCPGAPARSTPTSARRESLSSFAGLCRVGGRLFLELGTPRR